MRRRFLLAAAAWAALCSLSPTVAAQPAFPNGPVTIIQPFPAGGPFDAVSRALAERLQAIWKVPVVVENRTGAGGQIGTSYVVHARPDGQTLLLNSGSLLSVQSALFKNLPYNVRTDLAPVSGLASLPLLYVVHPSVPVGTMRELVDYGKANPKKMAFGSAGVGSGIHGALELFRAETGVDFVHVPYRGSAPSIMALRAGEVQVVLDVPTASLPHIRSGTLKPIALTGPARLKELPDVPTVAEAGFPRLTTLSWLALFAPAKTPASVIAAVDAAVAQAMQMSEMRETLEKIQLNPAYRPHADVTSFLSEEIARFAQAAKTVGLEPIDLK